MFEQLLALFAEKGREFWTKPIALAIVLPLVVCGLVQFFIKEDIVKIAPWEWVVISSVCILVIVVWSYARRIPTASKGSVGFGVAILFEDPKHQVAVRTDLISRLTNLLSEHSSVYQFQLIEFPQHLCRKLDRDSASKFLRKSRCKFLIFGIARLREQKGKSLYVFNLTGIVSHAPIRGVQAKQLETEFSTILPSRLNVEKEGDFFTFEFTANWFDIVTRYIVGVAAYLTKDFKYAESLLLSLEKQLEHSKDRLPAITHIKQWIPGRLREIYQETAFIQSHRYSMKRDKRALEELEKILDKLQARYPHDHSAHHSRAFIAFVLHRDIETTRKELDACSSQEESQVLFSQAFLDAYEGDLQAAYKKYRKAFEITLPTLIVPLQVEEFIQIVIDEEPERTDLYYCLGLVNYRSKCDLDAATRDFQKFLDSTDESKYPRQHKAARKWLGEIERLRRTN